MSLKTLIYAALGECEPCTMECTTSIKASAIYSAGNVALTHIEQELITAIHEYCHLSQLHSDVQALVDDSLQQPPEAQTDLLAHFQVQVQQWSAIKRGKG